jgi:ElaB/YqjD/DUF883 family membrane-anchored ribosome-binding protein
VDGIVGIPSTQEVTVNRDQAEAKSKLFMARIRRTWGDLTDDEVRKAEGSMDELIARIQERYGASRDAIAKRLNELKTASTTERAGAMLHEVNDEIRERAQQVRQSSEDVLRVVGNYVRDNPLTAVGLALVVGAVISSLRRRT